MTQRIPPFTCICGYEMDATGPAKYEDHFTPPVAGDVSLCFRCARIWIFQADLTMREPSKAESQDFITDDELQKKREKIISFHKTFA